MNQGIEKRQIQLSIMSKMLESTLRNLGIETNFDLVKNQMSTISQK